MSNVSYPKLNFRKQLDESCYKISTVLLHGGNPGSLKHKGLHCRCLKNIADVWWNDSNPKSSFASPSLLAQGVNTASHMEVPFGNIHVFLCRLDCLHCDTQVTVTMDTSSSYLWKKALFIWWNIYILAISVISVFCSEKQIFIIQLQWSIILYYSYIHFWDQHKFLILSPSKPKDFIILKFMVVIKFMMAYMLSIYLRSWVLWVFFWGTQFTIAYLLMVTYTH